MENLPAQTSVLDKLLSDISAERAQAKKPLAVALIAAMREPPPQDMLEGIKGTPSADDWRKIIGNMAKPRSDEITLEAGARQIARQFVAGDKDAARMVRDTLDGIPVQETKLDAQSALLAGAAAGATAALIGKLEFSLLALKPGACVVDSSALVVEPSESK